MSRDQWSQTPASNDLSGYGQTGMAPSKVKNAFWDVMADLTVDASLPTSAGTANAQTVTNTRQFGALFTGMYQWFLPGFTNTGAVTLAVDGLAAKNIFANGIAAIAGMLVTNVPALVKYDGTQWNLMNPQRSTGSFTLTISTSYLTVQQTGTINYGIGQDGKSVQVRNTVAIIGTSNATTMIGTGVPSILAPTTSTSGAHRPFYLGEDNSAFFIGFLDVGQASAGQWQFFGNTTLSTGGFTNTGTKGFQVCEFSFNKD